MAPSTRPFFYKILTKQNTVKSWLHRFAQQEFRKDTALLMNQSFSKVFFELFSKSLASSIYLETKVAIAKKKNRNTVLGYTSSFVLLSSLRSSPYLRCFSILQAMIRRDYLRQVLFQLKSVQTKVVLVENNNNNNTVLGYTSVFILLLSLKSSPFHHRFSIL